MCLRATGEPVRVLKQYPRVPNDHAHRHADTNAHARARAHAQTDAHLRRRQTPTKVFERRHWACPSHTSAPGTRLAAATSAPRLGLLLRLTPAHVRAGTGTFRYGNDTHPPKCSGFYHDQEQVQTGNQGTLCLFVCLSLMRSLDA